MAIACKKALDGIKPFVPARSIESIKRKYGLPAVTKLAGNENNYGVSPAVRPAVLAALDAITRYPDAQGTQLREALSRHLGVAEEELVLANGSFELLMLTAQAFLEEGTEALVPYPSFGWYKIVTAAANAVPVGVPLVNHAISFEVVQEHITDKMRVLWLCNPNNPTGTYFTAAALDSFLRAVPPRVLVVLDEAYIDFAASDAPRATELIRRQPNVLALRTFSKVYGLASLRVGYALGPAGIIDELAKIRQPPAPNSVAQAAALAALGDRDFYRYVVAENERGRQQYYAALKELGVSYIPTQGNFIMLDTGRDGNAAVETFLRVGILVRSGGEFGMPSWVRITVGTEQENRNVLEVLAEIMEQKG
jgi:histidinol-phosphate aminotransferase